jgi:hypothetical protein
MSSSGATRQLRFYRQLMGLFMSDARAQYYLGGQAGWTGLPSQTDTIDGVRTIPVTFSAGYNVGVRGGYRLGP